MKKFLTLFVILMFTLFVAACGTTTKKPASTTGTTGSTTTTTATTGSTTATTTATTAITSVTATRRDTSTHTGDPVVVTITTWGFGTEAENNLLRRKIAKFNELYDDIEIQIVMPEGNYNEFLATKAAAGEFPDIVAVGNVSDFVLNNYIGDIKDIANADAEWLSIPEALRDSVTYSTSTKTKVYAIPSAYHYLGFYANLDLIENSGIDTIFDDFTYTANDFFAAVEAVTNIAGITDGTGTIGIQGTDNLVNWLPSVYDTTGKIQHFAYNGSTFEYTSQPMKNAIAKASQLHNMGYSFNYYSGDARGTAENPLPSYKQLYFGDNDSNKVFHAGKMGFVWDASWAASNRATNIGDNFNFDFIGVPGGKVVGVSDYYGISKSAQDKQAAYEVAKYLTFGLEGILDSFEIIEDAKANEVDANGKPIVLTMPGLPINENQYIIDTWFNTFPMPGFKNAYEKAAAGEVTVLMEGNKSVPGFQVARFSYDTGIDALITRPTSEPGKTLTIGDFIWDAAQAKINYSNYMTTALSDKLNAEFQKAKDALEVKINE